MKINITFIITLSFFFTILYNCNKPSIIKFENTIFDFGEVYEGSDINYTYIFKNTGTKPVTIRHVQPSCVCLTILGWDNTVEPGETGEIPVTFKTPNLNGDIIKYINVKTGILKEEHQSIKLIFKGRVVIPIEIVPKNPWLGDVTHETRYLSGSFKIKNNLDTPLRILKVTPPDNKTQYKLTTIEENKQYSLDYIMYPPFEGDKTVEKKFILLTDNEEYEYVELKLFLFIVQPL